MKKEIVQEARERAARGEIGSEVVRDLEAGPPAKAKEWAEQNGLPEHLHPGKGHAQQKQASSSAGGGAAQQPSGSGLPLNLPPRQAPQQPPVPPAAPRRAAAVPPDSDDTVGRIAQALVNALGGGAAPPVRPRRGAAVGGGAAPAPPVRPGRGAAAGAPAGPGAGPAWSRESWCTPELVGQVQAALGAQGQHRDERNLLGGVPEQISQAHGGTNETSRVMLDNGITGYHKPFAGANDRVARGFGQASAQQPMHEVAAWRLAEQLGEPYDRLVPPCVLREVNGKVGSFAMERPGKQRVRLGAIPEDERHAAAFFDALIGQQDRHPNNYLVAGDRVTLIDHGYSFARGGDLLNFSQMQAERSGSEEKVRRLSGAEISALDKLIDSGDGLGLRGVLEPDRFSALMSRAERMRRRGLILGPGEYS